MDDDTQPMEAVKTDHWSIQSWGYDDPDVGFGHVSRVRMTAKPWTAYLAFVDFRQESFSGTFATAEEAKAAINARADQFRALQDARVTA